MANPRAVVDFEGIGVRRETYIADNSTIVFDSTESNGSAQVGLAVQLTGNATVALTEDGTEVLGRLERVHADGMCVVQTHGGCSLPAGDGATVTAGSKIVGDLGAANAKGYIRNAVADSTDDVPARHTILDASTSTAVKVMLNN